MYSILNNKLNMDFINLEKNLKSKFLNKNIQKNVNLKKFKRNHVNLFQYNRRNFFELTIMHSSKNPLSISDGMFLRIDKKWKNFFQSKESLLINDELYSPLHNHSDLSLLDGASRVSEMVKFTKELDMKSLSITDHGVMHAIVDLFKECEKLGIKPIAGNEMYVINGSISRNFKRGQLAKYHQIVLALTELGYENLVRLTTLSHLNGWQGSGAFGRPCISKRLLFKYKKDIVITSACLGGEICQNLLDKNFLYAIKIAEWYKNNFNDSFFLELQDHGHREDRAVNMSILKISEKLNIRLISTNDSHFTRDSDVEAHDTLLCIQTGKPFDEPGRMRYSGVEFLKSQEEMNNMYRDHVSISRIDSALNSSVLVSNQAKNYSIWAEITIPTFKLSPEFNHLTLDEFLEFLGNNGLDAIIKNKFLGNSDDSPNKKIENLDFFKSKYKKYYIRLKYELDSIKNMGFSTYFLVVWDFIDFARRNNVPIGSGRGSVAGSLVAYALGITNIDPIENGLLFERFLNPARKSMPDIDTDFSIDGRDKVIEYVSMKYGQEHVAQIITFNRLTSKAILKDMGKSARKDVQLIEKMSDLIPINRGKPMKIEFLISKDTPSQDFRQNYLKNNGIKTIMDKALNFEGMNKTTAVHAAGIVISSRKLDEVVPLTRGIKGEVVTQYPMEDVEYLGLLKMDFLGLKNLSMVENIVNFVNYRFKSQILSLDSSFLQPHFDKSVFNLLTRGDLDGVFQLDASPGMKNIVSEMKPGSIQDISSILALYRPGPLDTGLIPRFIKRKRKVFLYKFDYPELKETLGETYGILIYQEQIMKVSQELAGYSMSQADILRRAMGKKNIFEMRTQEKIFIEGCINNSLEKIAGQKIFIQMVAFAEYCFNKSHSTAYAFTTYQTAWLKSHWPVEFFSSLLSVNSTDLEKIEKFISQAASMGIFVQNPDINTSDVFFVPEHSTRKQNFINFGLGSIKNVGEIAASIIIAERKISGSFYNLIEIVNRLIDDQFMPKKLVETLILSGCLDQLEGEKRRKRILINLDKIIEWKNRAQKIKYLNQPLLLDLDSLKKEDNSGKKNRNSKIISGAVVLNTIWEQAYLVSNLIGMTGVNSSLLKQSELMLFLGTVFNLSVQSNEIYNTQLIETLNNQIRKKDFENTLYKIENIKISSNYKALQEFLSISIILEIHEYKTFLKKKLIKMVCEDLSGIFIATIFEKEVKIDKKKLNEIESEFFPGDFILGFGVEEEHVNGSRKLIFSRISPINGYKIILLDISTETLDCFSIHLLLKFNFTLDSFFSKRGETPIPLIINIKGKSKNEILKTGLSISEADLSISLNLFELMGFNFNLFQFNEVL